METSIILARLIGPVAAAVGLGVLLNQAFVREMAKTIASQRGLVFVVGILTLSLGVALVNFHNVWTADWRVLITAFGWLAVVGGLWRLVLPGLALAAGERMTGRAPIAVAGAAYVIYGLALSYFGYFA